MLLITIHQQAPKLDRDLALKSSLLIGCPETTKLVVGVGNRPPAREVLILRPQPTFSMPFNLRGEVSEHRHLPTRQAGGKTHPGPEKQARPLGADTWGPGCSHPRGPLPRCSSQEGGVAGEGGEGQGTAGEAAPGAPAAAGGTAAESRAAPGCPGGATAAEAAEEQGAFVRGPGQARVAPRARICMQARCVHTSAFTRAVRSRGAYISASVQARLVLCVPG